MKLSFELSRKSAGLPQPAMPTIRGGDVIKSRVVQPGHAKVIRDLNANMLRMYDAGMTNNLNADFPVSITSANAEILTSITATRSRARKLERDNPYANTILEIYQNNVVGADPFRLEMRVGKWVKNGDGKMIFDEDTETNRLIEEAWTEAGLPENCTARRDTSRMELYLQAISSVVRDGGIINRHHRAYPMNKFGYAIEAIEIDRLDHYYNRPASGTANEIQFSIEMDRWHAPIAYWILTRHPGDVFAWSDQPKYRERIDAKDIVALFGIRSRAGQYVGMSRFASIIQRLHRIDQYDIAEVTAAIWASCKPFFLIRKNTAQEYTGDHESAAGEKVSVSEPATGEILPDGYEPSLVNPMHPTEAYQNFTKQNLRSMAGGAGVAYHVLANDLEGVNFSSGRLGELQQRQGFKKLQQHMILNLVRPHFNEWLKYAIMSGALNLPISRLEEFKKAARFHGVRWPYVNPLQDAQADILRIEAGLDSRSHVIAESDRGGSFEEICSEQATDNEAAEAHGLGFSEDPAEPAPENLDADGKPLNGDSTTPPAKTGGKQTIKSRNARLDQTLRVLAVTSDPPRLNGKH